MNDEKVYRPQEIADTPFPLQEGDLLTTSQPSTNGIFKPQTIQDQPLPIKRVATETIASSFNTKSRKIIQPFEFTQQGALAIGKFEQGISGDVRVSPAGIISRSTDGLTTFALDGETGDATFAGEIRSGSSVTGRVVIEDGGFLQIGSDEGDTIIDELGIVSVNNFRIFEEQGAPLTAFTNTSGQILSAQEISFTIPRITKALVSLSIVGSSEQINSGLDCTGRTTYTAVSLLNGNETNLASFFYDSFLTVSSGVRENIISKAYSTTSMAVLQPGTHSVYIEGRIGLNTNFRSILNEYFLTVALLGS